MTFTDTHCHIHEHSYQDADKALARAESAGVRRLICVGTDEVTSAEAVRFAESHENCWASVGLHPHEAKNGLEAVAQLEELLKSKSQNPSSTKIVAIGECGLDYFYEHSSKDIQIEMFHAQMKLAQHYDLPVIFHVRDASSGERRNSVWDDFWPIFDQYPGTRGVLHSYTDTTDNLTKGLDRGLYIGVNGISTFTNVDAQREMYAAIPLKKLLLETDAPFLTPVPHRGTVNEPAFMTYVAQHCADLHNTTLEELSTATQRNATHLFLNK